MKRPCNFRTPVALDRMFCYHVYVHLRRRVSDEPEHPPAKRHAGWYGTVFAISADLFVVQPRERRPRMAMRMPRLFRPVDSSQLMSPEWPTSGPRPICEPAPVLQWPLSKQADACSEAQQTTSFTAQVRTKRFPGRLRAEEDRYSTVIEPVGLSTSALLNALARAMETTPELSQ
ncbi:hypothetical protein BH24CHL4_BH24CHL4_14030 [soil metagenome]